MVEINSTVQFELRDRLTNIFRQLSYPLVFPDDVFTCNELLHSNLRMSPFGELLKSVDNPFSNFER